MNIKIHHGSTEYDDCCIEITTRNSRILIAVGTPFDDPNTVTASSKDAKGSRTKSLAEKIPGLFASGPAIDAIILTSAHVDNTPFLQDTLETIPVYLTPGISKLIEAGSYYGRTCAVPVKRRHVMGGELHTLRAKGDSGLLTIGCPTCDQVMLPDKPVKIGDFTITIIPVNHDTLGCVNLWIEAEGKRVLYAGDLRLHGRDRMSADQLIRLTLSTTLDALILNGSHFARIRKDQVHSTDLEDKLIFEMGESPGLVLAMFVPSHLDRLMTFYQAAWHSGRILVVDPFTAEMLVQTNATDELATPLPIRKAGIKVYYPKDFPIQRTTLLHGKKCSRVTLEAILEAPQKYVMLFRHPMLVADFGGQLPPKTRIIYSYWHGCPTNQAGIAWKKLKAAVSAAKGEFVEYHSSGFQFTEDILAFVWTLNPNKILPLQCEGSNRFDQFFENQTTYLKDGTGFTLK
ncbi:MAG: MBL fold metallo-hydrolase [Verrucomicrobiota bacterium]